MTKYEKLSTFLGAVALIAAVASPFITYRWLDPQFQSFRNRPRLQISLGIRGSGGAGMRMVSPDRTILTTGGADRHITIVNTGELPAKDVLITAQYTDERAVEKTPTLNPPYPSEISLKENIQFVTLRRPIAPHDVLEIIFPIEPKVIWVSTEYGETTTLITGASAFDINEKTNEITPIERVPQSATPTPKPNKKEIERSGN